MSVWIIECRKRNGDGEWRLEQPYRMYKLKAFGEAVVRDWNEKRKHHEYRLSEFTRKD